MTEAEINEEIGLLLRAVRSEQFRFVVVQYNHFALLQQVRQNLEQSYPGRASAAIHLNSTGTNGLSKAILDNKSGFVFLYEFETLLSDATAARTLNQQRDKLSAYPVILVAFLPSGSQWLQDCARKMPDLWSLRTLLLDLKQEISPGIERIFEQIETKRFSDLSVAEKTIEAMDLKARLASLEDIPENRSYKASLLLSLGEIDYLMGNYDNAKSYWEKSLKLVQEISDRQREGALLNNLSQIYDAKGDYDIALDYLQKSLTITQEIVDRQGEGITLNNISQIYDAKGDYDMTLNYLQKSLAILQEIGDRYSESATLSNIGHIFEIKGDYQNALSYLQRSLEIQQQIGYSKGEGTTLNNISLIYQSLGDLETSLSYLQKSLTIRQKIGDIYGQAVTLHNIGRIGFKKENWVLAISSFIQSYQLLNQIGSPNASLPNDFLNNIIEHIGQKKFNAILLEIQAHESPE